MWRKTDSYTPRNNGKPGWRLTTDRRRTKRRIRRKTERSYT